MKILYLAVSIFKDSIIYTMSSSQSFRKRRGSKKYETKRDKEFEVLIEESKFNFENSFIEITMKYWYIN